MDPTVTQPRRSHRKPKKVAEIKKLRAEEAAEGIQLAPKFSEKHFARSKQQKAQQERVENSVRREKMAAWQNAQNAKAYPAGLTVEEAATRDREAVKSKLVHNSHAALRKMAK